MKPISPLVKKPIQFCEECGGAVALIVTNGVNDWKVSCLCDCKSAELEEQEEQERAMRKAYQMQQLKADTFGKSSANIPCFDDCDDATDAEALKTCINYTMHFNELIDGGHGLILYGSPDQGKTFLSKCIAGELYKTNMVRFINAATYVDMCGGFDRFPGGKIRSESTFALCDLLILDDLGSERSTPFAQECILDLINTRYERELPTIVTTNLDIEEMTNPETIMQKRIYNRLMDRCLLVQVECERKRVKKDKHEEMKKIMQLD